MNKVYILIGVILSTLIIGVVIFFINSSKNKVEIKEIKHLYFSYSNGYARYSYVNYKLDYEDGKYFAIIKPDEVPDEDSKKVEVDKDTINEIITVLKKYEVEKWNGYKKSDKNVLDGDSFSFSLTNMDDSSISASGYMMWPKNYGNVKGSLDSIFSKLYEKAE